MIVVVKVYFFVLGMFAQLLFRSYILLHVLSTHAHYALSQCYYTLQKKHAAVQSYNYTTHILSTSTAPICYCV